MALVTLQIVSGQRNLKATIDLGRIYVRKVHKRSQRISLYIERGDIVCILGRLLYDNDRREELN